MLLKRILIGILSAVIAAGGIFYGVTYRFFDKPLTQKAQEAFEEQISLPDNFILAASSDCYNDVKNTMQAVHDSVKEGESMAGPMAASGIFPPMVISMVEVGEETGALPDMFVRIANTYDDEVDNAVAGMTSVIEPLMIVFLAVVVGTIVIAMFLPLIKIIGSLSQQAG